MPKYVVLASYEAEAEKDMMRHPADRLAAVRSLIEAAGGKQEGFYWMLGPYDSLGVIEMPDARAMTAVAMASVSAGISKRLETYELIDHADIPEIEEHARSLIGSFSTPGEES